MGYWPPHCLSHNEHNQTAWRTSYYLGENPRDSLRRCTEHLTNFSVFTVTAPTTAGSKNFRSLGNANDQGLTHTSCPVEGLWEHSHRRPSRKDAKISLDIQRAFVSPNQQRERRRKTGQEEANTDSLAVALTISVPGSRMGGGGHRSLGASQATCDLSRKQANADTLGVAGMAKGSGRKEWRTGCRLVTGQISQLRPSSRGHSVKRGLQQRVKGPQQLRGTRARFPQAPGRHQHLRSRLRGFPGLRCHRALHWAAQTTETTPLQLFSRRAS